MRTIAVSVVVGALCAAVVGTVSPRAQSLSPDAERGRELAVKWCAACHVIGVPGQTQALADAPSFHSLAERAVSEPGLLALALLRPHPVMPSFPITQRDVAALSAYLASLREVKRSDAPTPASLTAQQQAGREIAERCAGCHAISPGATSPVADAPAFSTLSQRYPLTHLEEALAEGIVVNHPSVDMPEFVLDPPEIAAFLAYLEVIQD